MSSSHCQSCHHVVHGNVQRCPMCGGSMQQQTENTERTCPRCQIPLTLHHHKGCDLDQCTQCEGLWLEPKEFKQLTSEFSVYRDDESNPDYIRPAMPKAEGYLPCACCNKLMTRKNYKSVSGIVIDTCINCGIWLDKDELKHIRNFVASGGLDQAQDRQLFTQKQHIEKLDDRVSDLEMMEKMLNKFDLKRIFFRGF